MSPDKHKKHDEDESEAFTDLLNELGEQDEHHKQDDDKK